VPSRSTSIVSPIGLACVLDPGVRRIKPSARANLMKRAATAADSRGLAARGNVSSCVSSAEAEAAVTAGTHYARPAGRSVADRSQGYGWFASR
jgi:hypothetical protein